MVLDEEESHQIEKIIHHEEHELGEVVLNKLKYIADLVIYSNNRKKVDHELEKYGHYKEKIDELVKQKRAEIEKKKNA